MSSRFFRFSYFYPRPPRGGRRAACTLGQPVHIISIHALREEGDGKSAPACIWKGAFLSTPSARRATVAWPSSTALAWISIHALREEGDI